MKFRPPVYMRRAQPKFKRRNSRLPGGVAPRMLPGVMMQSRAASLLAAAASAPAFASADAADAHAAILIAASAAIATLATLLWAWFLNARLKRLAARARRLLADGSNAAPLAGRSATTDLAEALSRVEARLEHEASRHTAAHAALARTERDYRYLFEHSPTPMWVYDVESLAFLAVNDAAVALYGYSHDQFLSISMRDITHPDDIPAMLERIKSLPPGLCASPPRKHRRSDGSLIDIELDSHDLTFLGLR